jgi:DNA-binding CsgD family transcriptional regulator
LATRLDQVAHWLEHAGRAAAAVQARSFPTPERILAEVEKWNVRLAGVVRTAERYNLTELVRAGEWHSARFDQLQQDHQPLLDPQASPFARRRAAERLVARLRPTLAGNRAVRQNLHRLARQQGQSPNAFLREILTLGYLRATEELDHLQTIRLGSGWIRDQRKRKKLVRPRELPPAKLAYWFVIRAYRHAADLVGRSADTELVVLAARRGVRASKTTKTATRAVRLLELPLTASPRETEIAGWAAKGLNSYQIATRLRIAASTVRNHLAHLRRRARQV